MAKPKHTSKPTPDREPRAYMRYYSLVLELVVMNVALILGGLYLDKWLHTSPAAILLGTFLAMAGTIWLLLKSVK